MDRQKQIEQARNSDAIPGIKAGIIKRLENRLPEDRRRQQRHEAIRGMHRRKAETPDSELPAGFDAGIHVLDDGVPVLNKDGSFRKKPGRKA